MIHPFRNLLCGFLLFLCIPASAQSLPEGFYDTPVAENLDFPLGVTFDETGRMYVWEKGGRVWAYDTTGERFPEPFIDISEEVAHFDEHGLNYFLLDKDFSENGRVYLLYVLDRHHFDAYGTPDYDPAFTIESDATIGRLLRYEADPNAAVPRVIPESRHVLIGTDLSDGIPILMVSHGLGSLQQGDDGSLLVSCGDGASFLGVDLGGDSLESWASNAIRLGIITPDQDIGSYKSQYLGALNGKILRVDPETGDGYPSNPWFIPGSPRHPSSRAWVMGLRNPYRFVRRPLSGSHDPAAGRPGQLIIGDVGGANWEELNVAPTGGLNFGWPVFEGQRNHWGFNNAPDPPNPLAPNPRFGGDCEQRYFGFKELVMNNNPDGDRLRFNRCGNGIPITTEQGFHYATPPEIFWNNRNWNPPTRATIPKWNEDHGGYLDRISIEDSTSTVSGENFTGESSLGGVFYESDLFPPAYHGAYFHMDYSGWIRVFDFDTDGKLYRVRPFASALERPVHLSLNPHDGNLYYVSLEEQSVRQIGFGGNPPPVALVEERQFFGGSELEVRFRADQSYDPNGSPISFHWDFGDGDTAIVANPVHRFSTTSASPRKFTVALTVTDAEGATDREEIVVSLNNGPPEVEITSFADGDRYPTDETTLLDLAARVNDREHAADDLTYAWQVFFHHNTHFHPEPVRSTPLAHALIAPAGCGEETYWYRIRLTVTDPEGLRTEREHSIYPNCSTLPADWVILSAEEGVRAIDLSFTTQLPPVDYVEVQKSTDFYDYRSVGRIDGDPSQSYRLRDENPYFGIAYYRVKARTTEGNFYYSTPLPVQYPAAVDHLLAPNPARGLVSATIQESAADYVRVSLFSVAGKRLLQTKYAATNGEAWKGQIDLSGLPPGLYLYRLESGDRLYSGRLVVD